MTKVQKQSALVWGGFVIAMIGLLWFLAKVSSATPAATTNPNAGQPTGAALHNPVSESDHAKGLNDAAVTLVEYSDFQCPACAQTHPILQEVMRDFGDKIKLVYRHYPLRQIHPNAQLAAQATEAAANQGKFWEMHDKLFETQTLWSQKRDATEHFKKLAEELELDADTFAADLTSGQSRDIVNAHYSGGSLSGVQGTPSFFINGQKITHPGSYQGFKFAIENALAAVGQPATQAETPKLQVKSATSTEPTN